MTNDIVIKRARGAQPSFDETVSIYSRISNWCSQYDILYLNGFSKQQVDEDLIKNCTHPVIVFCMLMDQIRHHNSKTLYDHWSHINELCCVYNKKVWFVTDSIYNEELYQFSHVKIKSCPELLGIQYHSDEKIKINTNPSRLYNCFMQRIDSIRQSWFYMLHRHNLLDKGYVSFWLTQKKEFKNGISGLPLFDYIHHQYQLNKIPEFEKSYQQLRNTVPYCNFQDNGSVTTQIVDSKYSVILETFATHDDVGAWSVTEKLMKSLHLPNITLAFCQKHLFRELKKLGIEYDTLLDDIDHLDWVDRQNKILDILIHDKVDIDPIHKYNQCVHNQHILETWKLAYLKSDFFDQLFDEIISLR